MDRRTESPKYLVIASPGPVNTLMRNTLEDAVTAMENLRGMGYHVTLLDMDEEFARA